MTKVEEKKNTMNTECSQDQTDVCAVCPEDEEMDTYSDPETERIIEILSKVKDEWRNDPDHTNAFHGWNVQELQCVNWLKEFYRWATGEEASNRMIVWRALNVMIDEAVGIKLDDCKISGQHLVGCLTGSREYRPNKG